MSRVRVTTLIGERLTTVEVDRRTLSRTMRVNDALARFFSKRPGQQHKAIIMVDGKLVEQEMSYDRHAVIAATELTPQPREKNH